MRLGFAGLGTMGRPIVRRLVAAGHEVTVWNRSPAPVAESVADGATAAADLAEVFAQPVVFSMLAHDDAVREQVLNSGVLHEAACELHVNLATVSTGFAQEAATAHEAAGIGYLAAPVLGRADVAQAGALNVLVAGPDDALAAARPLLHCFAAKIWEIGRSPEDANAVKIAVNFMLGAAIEAMAEAVSLVESYDVDAAGFVELISSTLFPGPVYTGYGRLMAARQYKPAGFTARLGLKDTRLALNTAHDRDLALPTAALVQDQLLQLIAHGAAESDWAALAETSRDRMASRTDGVASRMPQE